MTWIAKSSLSTANKGAIHSLARALALAAELIGRSIRVNIVAIDPTATQLLPGPFGVFADDSECSRGGAYQPFSGQTAGAVQRK